MFITARELQGRHISLEPMEERHREGLRLACAADPEIWTIYPYSLDGDHFDATWDMMVARAAKGGLIRYAVMRQGLCLGQSCFSAKDAHNRSVEIGGTYYTPDQRGGVVNPEAKLLMLDHAFSEGAHRVAFRVDAINTRSRAAMTKLGATFEGIMRDDMVTWTGRVRSTCVFSILKPEWPAIRAGLASRVAAFG